MCQVVDNDKSSPPQLTSFPSLEGNVCALLIYILTSLCQLDSRLSLSPLLPCR